jgi:hypothetical protein
VILAISAFVAPAGRSDRSTIVPRLEVSRYEVRSTTLFCFDHPAGGVAAGCRSPPALPLYTLVCGTRPGRGGSMQVMLPWATMIAVLAPALAVLPTPAAAGWDDTIAAVHARAAAVREARLAAFDRTDFDHAANGHHPIPPETSPRSQTWTGKGFQLIAAALGVQFHGKNQSAMRKAAELVSNMTDNFQYNGYAPTSESGCVTKALSVYCNGTTRCGAALGQLCDASRAPAGNATAVACLQCVARHVGDPSLASCSDAEVTSFCASPRGTRSSQTEAQCTACANGLKSIEMTCHILHNPVMQLPIYNCDGCSPTAVQGYCATVGSVSACHHEPSPPPSLNGQSHSQNAPKNPHRGTRP